VQQEGSRQVRGPSCRITRRRAGTGAGIRPDGP